MPTGRSIVSNCFARAALAGNPSDGYGGAVVAVPVLDLAAFASAEPAEVMSIRAADPDLRALLRATADAFAEAVGPIGNFTLSATTTIPRSVGLAGSSALVISALRALAATCSHRFDPIDLAQLALSIERDRLGIEAGLQDRLVQAVGQPVAMTFEPVTYRALEPPDDLPLFVAWSPAGSQSSGTVHRSLRRRFDGGDPNVRASMSGLAEQAHLAGEAITTGRLGDLGAAISRTFEIRSMMIDIDPITASLAQRAMTAGARVNSAGSGGSIVGLARSVAHLTDIENTFRASGVEFLRLS